MLGIVIPAYKRKDCLRQALQSLCYQTYKKFFVIVVDDHSPEPLKDIVEEFDDRLHIIYRYAEENGGPGVARQIGLNLCYEKNFDLVMFLDSDDMLYPHAVARLTYEINHTKHDIISSAIWSEDKNGTGDTIAEDNKTWLHGKIYRTAYLKNNNISFPSMRANEDLAFNLMAIENTKKKGVLNETLYLFRHEANSITRSSEKSLSLLSFDYIDALYEAQTYLAPRVGVTNQMIINILSSYNYYQAGVALGVHLKEETKEHLRYLLRLPEIQDVIHSPSKLNNCLTIFRTFFVFEKQIYYFTQTLENWLKEFAYEDSNN